MGDQPCREAANYTGKYKHDINADIHASSRIRKHNPNVWVSEDISYYYFSFIIIIIIFPLQSTQYPAHEVKVNLSLCLTN
jgi:hypothetical protein